MVLDFTKGTFESEQEKDEEEIKNNKIIQDAISHLNGYALIIETKTGFVPVAINDTIKELNSMVKK